jgi:hypothetical protein
MRGSREFKEVLIDRWIPNIQEVRGMDIMLAEEGDGPK